MRSLLLLLAVLMVASLGVLTLEAAEGQRIEWDRLQRDFYLAWEAQP